MRLLALVDALHAGTLNEAQKTAVRELRTGLTGLIDQDGDMPDDQVFSKSETRVDDPGSPGQTA